MNAESSVLGDENDIAVLKPEVGMSDGLLSGHGEMRVAREVYGFIQIRGRPKLAP